MVWRDHASLEQCEAIASPGNCCVIAGPGTGKTRTLLVKALQLIEDNVAAANRIRIVNFTNDGTLDLKRQITEKEHFAAVIDPESVSTFHSLALTALKRSHAPSVREPAAILDDWEEGTFLDRFVKAQLNLDRVTKAQSLRQDYSSRWCLSTEDDVDWYADESIRRAYEAAYLDVKNLLGCLTRGELTYLWWQHLRSNPNVQKDDIGIDADWLFLDEYQDLNQVEHDIISLLVEAGIRIYAVGDPNQAIYETMRHAHPRYCTTFTERVPDSAKYVLDRSYRCPSKVLEYGAALLNFAEGIPDPEKASTVGAAHILSFRSYKAEEDQVATLAKHLLTTDPKARVLLALPAKSLAPGFEKALAPHVEVENRTKSVKENDTSCRLATALLRLRYEPKDGVAAATAIVLMGARSKIDEHARDLLIIAHTRGQRVSDLLLGGGPLEGTLGKAVEKARTAMDSLRDGSDISTTLLELTGCEHAQILASFLDELVNLSPESPAALEPGRVTIMTLHKSKGLEAEHVILPVVEPGTYERDAAGTNLSERRRLLYVGMTRAITTLYLTFAKVRRGASRYADATGGSIFKQQSTFIDEICNRLGIRPEDGDTFVSGLSN